MERAELVPSILVFKATVRATLAVVKAGHNTDREREFFKNNWNAWEEAFDVKKQAIYVAHCGINYKLMICRHTVGTQAFL